MRRMLVITAALAWGGGMATMLVGGSCDLECRPDARPAVVLSLRPMDGTIGDVLRIGTHVAFSIEAMQPPEDPFDTLREPVTEQLGRCLDDECLTWAIGADRPGRYVVTATLCGHTYETEIEVGLDEEGCHAETQYETILFDASRCNPEEPVREPPPPQIGPMCDTMVQPSAYVWVGVQEGTVYRSVEVDRVWYEHMGTIGEGECVQPNPYLGGCSAWTVGRDLVGPMTIHTTYCDTDFTQDIVVEKTENRCHADTEFVRMQVNTMGCLRDPSRDPIDPNP